MSDIDSVVTVEYRNNRYTVAIIRVSGHQIPILLDREVYKAVRKLNKKWYINDKNHIYCLHQKDGETQYPVYLHEIVIKLSKHTDLSVLRSRAIIHINNIHFDNRLENLQFDLPNKDYSKNTKKKSRIIDLSDHGIDVDKLPTYLWYLKPDTSHGARFTIDIPGQIHWRTTASKKVSLRYKLEEAKKYLRYIKKTRPDIFESYSMNGDLTAIGLRLLKEYKMMIKKAGFSMNDPDNNKTDMFLTQDISGLSTFEIFLLHSFEPERGTVDINSILVEYNSIMGCDN